MWIASNLMLHQALAAAIGSISISHSGLTRALTMIVAETWTCIPKVLGPRCSDRRDFFRPH
jgi:hypothetical protein